MGVVIDLDLNVFVSVCRLGTVEINIILRYCIFVLCKLSIALEDAHLELNRKQAFKDSAMNIYNSNFSDESVHSGLAVTKSIQVAVVFKKNHWLFWRAISGCQVSYIQQQQH